MNLPSAIEDDWIRKSQKIQRKIYLYLLTHDQHIYLISVIVNLHLMVVFSYVVKDAGVDLLQRVFHISGWVSHIRSPTPIFSPISREYSENIVFHIYHRTFLVAKKLLEVSIV